MNQAVILSEAKNHLATLDRLKMILRFAQDDRLFRAFHCLALCSDSLRYGYVYGACRPRGIPSIQ